jgi:hypothetical protein
MKAAYSPPAREVKREGAAQLVVNLYTTFFSHFDFINTNIILKKQSAYKFFLPNHFLN